VLCSVNDMKPERPSPRVLMTTSDVARALDVSGERVRQLERAGILQAQKTLRGVRIYASDHVEAVRRERAAARTRLT
jgi:DNA-binding transcriptional MerR regulator